MPELVPLAPQAVAGLHWQHFTDYRHAAQRQWVPITGSEASRAAAHLPLCFVRTSPDRYQFAVLLGLEADFCAYLDAQNRWRPGYAPALLRVTPFQVLPPKDNQQTQRVVGVDLQSPWVSESGSEAFFEGKEPTASVQEITRFLIQMETGFVHTQRAVDYLASHDLLEPLKLPDGHQTQLPGIYTLNEKAFNQLRDNYFLKLRTSGGLALAYAQMLSTAQLPTLMEHSPQSGAQVGSRVEPDLDSLFGGEQDLFKF